jgi:glycosyltransferase involved in cell wall biosynthesis
MELIDNVKISVITVTFNAVDVLEQTILSVLNQSFKNIELIIIDGKSSDGTVELINKYSDMITLVSEPDKGIYDAMNKGVKIATGDWIYFLGAGDILLNVLHKILPHLKARNTIYYGDVYKLDELKIYDGEFSPFKFAVKNICHQSIFYPSMVFKRYEFDLKYRLQADYDLNLKCYGDKQIHYVYVPALIAAYDGDGMSANILDIPFFKDKLKSIKLNFSLPVYGYVFLRNKLAQLIKKDHWKNLNDV